MTRYDIQLSLMKDCILTKPMMQNSTQRIFESALLIVMLMIASNQSFAQTRGNISRSDPFIEQSQSFLDSHPDLKFRNYGMRSYQKGEFTEAMKYFQRAAYYADKPSQGMIGEMYWNGQSVVVDKALAYAWLDLAAERQYPNLLSIRERYWKNMSAAEQERAVVVGSDIYKKYGDEIAKKRLETTLRIARKKTTGSRTGFVGSLTILLAGPDGEGITVDGSQFYNEQYWKPEKYWQWQDNTWKNLSNATATMGELEPIKPEVKP